MQSDAPPQARQRALIHPTAAQTSWSPMLGHAAAELLGFRVEVHSERRTRVAPVGELDLATVPELRHRLIELGDAGFASMVLDLRGVSFIDSSGLHLILAWAVHCDEQTIAFEIIPGPAAVQRVFELTGTLDRLPFCGPQRPCRLPVRPRDVASTTIRSL